MTVKPFVPSSSTKQDSRNSALDLLRVLAAFGVIFIHIHTSTSAAENTTLLFIALCVPFFFTTSLVYFAASLNSGLSVQRIMNRIWNRIGIPFLIWSSIYIGLLVIKAILTGGARGLQSINLIRIFLYGESAEQMYYLPELIIMQLIILSVFLLVTNVKRVTGLYLFIAAIVYLAWGYYHHYFGVTSLFYLLTYLIMAFYLAPRLKDSTRRWPELIAGIGLIFLAVSNIWEIYPPIIRNSIVNLPIGGLGLFLLGMNSSSIRVPIWTKTLSLTTYGIYLSHVVFLEFIEFFIEKYQFEITYNVLTKFILTCLVFAISAVFVSFVKKTPIARRLLLGEDK